VFFTLSGISHLNSFAMNNNEDQPDMNNPKARLNIAARKKLIKDLNTLKTITQRHERFFSDMIAHKVPVRFANARQAHYKAVIKAIELLITHINDEGRMI
jgi:hypothetical protein